MSFYLTSRALKITFVELMLIIQGTYTIIAEIVATDELIRD